MQKWEYCRFETFPAEITYFDEGASKKEKPPKGDYALTIARLGNQGWELVTAQIRGSEASTFFFKRPKLD